MIGRPETLVDSFLTEPSETIAQDHLSELIIGHAQPLVQKIVGHRLRALTAGGPESQDVDDLGSDVIVQLISRLRALKDQCGAGPDQRSSAIGDFPGYVAVTAYHACNEYLRRKRPERWRLKNRLRYLVSHQPAFGLWEGAHGGWLCGLSTWRTQAPTDGTERLLRLQGRPDDVMHEVFPGVDVWHMNLTALLRALFVWIGSAVDLDALVNVVAELQGLHEPSRQSVDTAGGPDAWDPPGRSVSVATTLEQRSYLRRLWEEIRELPARQRAALLLNLRDSGEPDAIALLPFTGVASIRTIAAALALSAEELARLWKDLPLDDNRIAGLLGISRQQVINLRKAARARLARRMLAVEGRA